VHLLLLLINISYLNRYLHGKGTKQNKTKALKLFRTAAKQGNAEAFYNLGVLSMSGEADETKNQPEFESAYNYFHVAAQHGHTLSMHKVAQVISSSLY